MRAACLILGGLPLLILGGLPLFGSNGGQPSEMRTRTQEGAGRRFRVRSAIIPCPLALGTPQFASVLQAASPLLARVSLLQRERWQFVVLHK